jgi:biopolymer transport protein ExbB/TolQ
VETRFSNIPQYADKLLPRVVLTALRRFHSSHSIQDVSQAVREISESEADRLDSELSLIRYVAWAIPSVGFVGTVRGIGEALTKADQAIRGNIQGVTDSLGLAFNSTLIALFLSIILMYFIHLLQSRQESLILETEEYCRNQLLAVMKIPFKEESEMSIT